MTDTRVFATIDFPADLRFVPILRAATAALCAAADSNDPAVYQVQLALSELLTNVVTHAYNGSTNGRIAVQTVCEAGLLVIECFDTGVPYTGHPGEPPLADDLLEGGYGLFLAEQSLDRLTYAREADGRNHWTLEKRLGAG